MPHNNDNQYADLQGALVFYLKKLIEDPQKLKAQFLQVMQKLGIAEDKHSRLFNSEILPSLKNCIKILSKTYDLDDEDAQVKLAKTMAKIMMTHPWITHIPEQNLCFRYLTLHCLNRYTNKPDLSQKFSGGN